MREQSIAISENAAGSAKSALGPSSLLSSGSTLKYSLAFPKETPHQPQTISQKARQVAAQILVALFLLGIQSSLNVCHAQLATTGTINGTVEDQTGCNCAEGQCHDRQLGNEYNYSDCFEL